MTSDDRSALQFRRMTETPIPQLILSLAAPTILSMLITSIYNLADTFFVGQISTSASGAVGVVSSLMAIIQALGFMLGHGAGTIISRSLGSRNTDAATRFELLGVARQKVDVDQLAEAVDEDVRDDGDQNHADEADNEGEHARGDVVLDGDALRVRFFVLSHSSSTLPCAR